MSTKRSVIIDVMYGPVRESVYNAVSSIVEYAVYHTVYSILTYAVYVDVDGIVYGASGGVVNNAEYTSQELELVKSLL